MTVVLEPPSLMDVRGVLVTTVIAAGFGGPPELVAVLLSGRWLGAELRRDAGVRD